jgi:thymidylate synthase
MHVIEANNVRDALPKAVEYLIRYGVPEETRNGPVFAALNPVAIRYLNPKQHVLLNPVRDANPFFHLIEAMWMLAGRQDGAFLDHYVKDFSKRFGNNGIIMDAYGFRWRHGLRFDQLDEIVAQLRKDPTTRQCVLQMWGAGEQRELLSYSAKPCNLTATFRITEGRLDMTVFNRSNDVIWGCCGANAVHFPLLQEYIAGRLRVEVGYYWQISTNLHLYLNHIDMMRKRTSGGEEETIDFFLKDCERYYEKTQPLVTYPLTFDEDLRETMLWIEDMRESKEVYDGNIANGFLREVVMPMAMAHQCYKNGDKEGSEKAIDAVIAEDWRIAGRQWLDRRHYEQHRRQLSTAGH